MSNLIDSTVLQKCTMGYGYQNLEGLGILFSFTYIMIYSQVTLVYESMTAIADYLKAFSS